jgi:hypothetical protein
MEERLSSWRDRLDQVAPRSVAQALPPEQAEICWAVGREIGEELNRQPRGQRTKFLAAVAEEIGKPRTLLYDLVGVGLMFPEGLLQQHWSWHTFQARRLRRLDAQSRMAQLSLLRDQPPWQSIRSTRAQGPAVPSPETRAADRSRAEEGKRYQEALSAFWRIHPYDQVGFLRECLFSLDPVKLHLDDRNVLEGLSERAKYLSQHLADRRLTGPGSG